MRSKITLVLLFLNVALFFFIFRFEREWRTESESFETRRRVLGSEAADIRTLDVAGQAPGTSYSLERRRDAWFLTQPVAWPANPIAVNRIVNELQLLEHVTSFGTADLEKNGQSLADYGLDKPKLTVTFTSGKAGSGASAGARTTVLRIGDATRVGEQLYLLSPDGKRIHVVSRTLAESLSIPIDELRSELLFDIPIFEAQSLSIQTAAPSGERSPSIRIRRDLGRWKFETPVIAFATKNDVELTINELDSLRAGSFPAGATGTPPSSAPAIRVTLEGNNRDETLFLGGPTGTPGSFYAQLMSASETPAVFTVAVSDALMSVLTNASDKLRDRHVLEPFDPGAVTAITLTAPNQPELDLQRLKTPAIGDDGARWQIVRRGGGSPGPQTLAADRDAVQRLLEQLQLLSALRFQSDAPTAADLAEWGLDGPDREVTLTLAGTPSSQITLQIGRPARHDTDVYARIAGTSSIYAVNPDILLETPVSPLAWRDRLLFRLPASAQITGLSLTEVPGGSVYYARKLANGETWSAALASEPVKRRAAIQAILNQLPNLHAKKFTEDGFPDKVFVADEMRTWRLKLEASVSLPAGAGAGRTETETLWLTERLGGAQQLAGSKEFGAVFEVEQPLVDALWALTYGPHDPGPPPSPGP